MFRTLVSTMLTEAKSSLQKSLGKRTLTQSSIHRLPKQTIDQLAEELSIIELPCKVQDEVIDEFFNDNHVHHGGQQQDDSVLANSTVIRRIAVIDVG